MQEFEKFSNNFKNSLKIAANLALQLNQKEVEPQHIFYGLLKQQGSVGAELFTSLNIKPEEVKNIITKSSQTSEQILTATSEPNPRFSEDSKKIIQKSIQVAYINSHYYVGTEHLLAAIIQINDTKVQKIFDMAKISEKNLTDRVVSLLKSASKMPDITETFKVINQKESKTINENGLGIQENVLDLFGNNLTDKNFQKKIDPVIGREEEIDRIIGVLSRRTKNNPILLGEPGVGKTAIIEGLAKKIMGGDVPEVLKNKKIYSIDLTTTVAGTMYRGEFENRIKQIIDEAKNHPEIILFIDEIHNIVGAGSASGSMDAANILKPALARGEIHCIGATTFDDYRKSIENDTALERRFQVVKIDEPTATVTKKILQGIKKYFEGFHGVTITDEAIEAAVDLSQKYLPEKFLPDKAIDLIDEAAAAIKVNRKITTQEKKIQNLNKQLADLSENKKEAIEIEDFRLALTIKRKSQDLELTLKELERTVKRYKCGNIGTISDQDIAKIITKMTGIPIEDLVASEKKKILNMEKKLNTQVIGQDKAITEVANFIKRSKAGLTPSNKPLASFMFVGPSGIGKTYTAKMLAKTMFGDEKALIKIDMSEYSEKFNISKLIGAPAGYVGYKESGQLTEKIKHKPYSVVLFDEIEKANPDVFDILLQVLDDGYLTDGSGRKINFQNTVIIMTSNMGSHHIKDKEDMGFDSEGTNSNLSNLEEKIIAETKNHFKIEFLNRLNKIIYFNPLPLPDIQKIVKLELEKLSERLKSKNINVEFDNSIIKHIAHVSYQPNEGARSIFKTIQTLIENPLAEKLLASEISVENTMHISMKNGIIKLSII